MKSALGSSPGVLALIVSEWFFDEVVQHNPEANPLSYRQADVNVKETQTVAWIRLPDDSAAQAFPAGAMAEATRTLPRDIASFTGREREFRQVTALADQAAGSGGVVGINSPAAAPVCQAGDVGHGRALHGSAVKQAE